MIKIQIYKILKELLNMRKSSEYIEYIAHLKAELKSLLTYITISF